MANARLAGGGDRVAWGAGLFALGGFADRVGLTSALSAAVPRRGERAPVHDRGVLLVHLLLVLAGGGEACTDIEHLRSQRDLFGAVGSHSTLYRALRGINGSGLGALWGAAATARGEAWSKRRPGGPLVVDIDSTLVEVHSENKQGAAPHYKGGFGFHPMMCSTGDGGPLWVKLRPGNAAANDIADHIEVLDAAISVLPAADAAGHRAGDDAALGGREMVLRVDAGGCSARIAAACREGVSDVLCKRAGRLVILGERESSWVADGELVQAAFPSDGSCSLWSSSVGGDVPDGEVEQFEGGLLVGEVPSVLGDLSELAVDGLDHVGIGYEIWCSVFGGGRVF